MKKKKLSSILGLYWFLLSLLIVLLFTDAAILAALPDLPLSGKITLWSIGGALLIATILYLVVEGRKIHNFFYSDIYEVSLYNYNQLKARKSTLALYTATNIEEMATLSEAVKGINRNLANAHLQVAVSDYDRIPLDYVDKQYSLVTYESLTKNLPLLIDAASSYRNVLLSASYDLGKDTLTKEEERVILVFLRNAFASYPQHLIATLPNHTGFYVFLPRIDSFSKINEDLHRIGKESALLRKGEDGITIAIPIHYTLVCYPFSDVGDMLPDLEYARRLGKDYNFYLPERLSSLTAGEKRLLSSSMNMNTASRILASINGLSAFWAEEESGFALIRTTLNQLISAFDIDGAGLLIYQDREDAFKTTIAVSQSGPSFFREGENVDTDFCLAIASSVDSDNSYFASKRSQLVSALGKAFDKAGFGSCFFYLVKDENEEPFAILYFLNKEREMPLDSYLRESLYVYSAKVGDYVRTLLRQGALSISSRLTREILKATHRGLYGIEAENYHLRYVSEGLMSLAPKAKPGALCYEALYGRGFPCDDCPLNSSEKMISQLGPWNVETSLSLENINDKRTRYLFVEKKSEIKEITDDLFDRDWLTHSFYSLVRSMKNAYAVAGRGYLLLLRIDNLYDLVSRFGSEKVNIAIRSFAAELSELDTAPNVYTYKPDTLAILYNEMGQTDIITQCEKIFDLTRTSYFEDKKTLLHLTYLPIQFPQGYPEATSFLKHTEAFYFSGNYTPNKDYIYLDESAYTRSADKNQFMLDVIDEKFTKKKDFQVLLQPVVSSHNHRILGAEMLLRLRDDYRKTNFSTFELIQTAAKNGKIGIITDALMDYLADLSDQYGQSIFRFFGFRHLTINTDYSYLSDPDIVKKISAAIKNGHMPNDFLGLELNEKEIADHFAEMQSFIKSISSLPIILICDRYDGKYLSMDKLQELGFKYFKVDRFYTSAIDTDRDKYNTVRDMIEQGVAKGLTPILLGVENMNQAKMITEISGKVAMQGYAFYHPLEQTDLVEAIRTANGRFRKVSRE